MAVFFMIFLLSFMGLPMLAYTLCGLDILNPFRPALLGNQAGQISNRPGQVRDDENHNDADDDVGPDGP
jgi:hypothetical protein